MSIWDCGGNPGPFRVRRFWTGQGFLDGKISFFRQHLALGRTGRYSRSMSASSACCSRTDVFEHVLLRLLPRLAALAVHQLALERLEEGFRERVVPWAARPRHGSGDPMGLEAALERPGSVPGTLVVVEDEAEAVGRALPSDRLLERVRGQLLGHAPGHRPAHDLPAECVDHGREAGSSLARSDVGDVARP